MGDVTANVNWIAVAIGTVVSFMLGWLWYSPALFGKKWAAGAGVDLGTASNMPAVALVTQLAATFSLAWLIGLAVGRHGFTIDVLIVAMPMLFIVSNGLFAKKSSYAIAVEAGFLVAMGLVMNVVQALLSTGAATVERGG